jgi:hypothetical protein
VIDRRTFSAALVAGVAALMFSTRGMAANATPPKARNVVLVHGLFADGSCWTEVIARLQAAGLNVTSVQNPLTTLPEAVASANRVLRAISERRLAGQGTGNIKERKDDRQQAAAMS